MGIERGTASEARQRPEKRPEAARNAAAAKQAAESPAFEGFVTGHDFSRADKANQINRALAPEGSFAGDSRECSSFCAASKSLLKNPQTYRFVTGHDFSRADKANQINRALAPAVGLDKPV